MSPRNGATRVRGRARGGQSTSDAYDGLGPQASSTNQSTYGTEATSNVYAGTSLIQSTSSTPGTSTSRLEPTRCGPDERECVDDRLWAAPETAMSATAVTTAVRLLALARSGGAILSARGWSRMRYWSNAPNESPPPAAFTFGSVLFGASAGSLVIFIAVMSRYTWG